MAVTRTEPAEVVTDRARAYPGVLDELLPGARHDVEQYANNKVEADHGRLKARLRPYARAEDGGRHAEDLARPRLRAERASGPLRARDGGAAGEAAGRGVRRARPGDLIDSSNRGFMTSLYGTTQQSPHSSSDRPAEQALWAVLPSNNATHRFGTPSSNGSYGPRSDTNHIERVRRRRSYRGTYTGHDARGRALRSERERPSAPAIKGKADRNGTCDSNIRIPSWSVLSGLNGFSGVASLNVCLSLPPNSSEATPTTPPGSILRYSTGPRA